MNTYDQIIEGLQQLSGASDNIDAIKRRMLNIVYGINGKYTCLTTEGEANMRDRFAAEYAANKRVVHKYVNLPEIKNVIFNPPATIVFWADNTKTVVKAQEYDDFDPEVGLTMAITKKALGNKGSYYNTIKKWVGEYEKKVATQKKANQNFDMMISDVIATFQKAISDIGISLRNPESYSEGPYDKVWHDNLCQ